MHDSGRQLLGQRPNPTGAPRGSRRLRRSRASWRWTERLPRPVQDVHRYCRFVVEVCGRLEKSVLAVVFIFVVMLLDAVRNFYGGPFAQVRNFLFVSDP